MKNGLIHMGIVAAALFLCLGLPFFHYVDVRALLSGSPDAMTSASMDIPDQPSGEYLVLVNRKLHPLSMEDWTAFFEEREVGVIMEDIDCLVVDGDVTGAQLADRYQLRLAQNQMQYRTENGTLVVSRAEAGAFDVIILSKEVADSFDYSAACLRPEVAAIEVRSENL